MPDWHERKCVISLKQVKTVDALDRLKNSLICVDGINAVEFSGNSLFIHYKFPGLTAGDVLKVVGREVENSDHRFLNRIKNRIVAFMESNERDYMLYTGGWRRYIEDIYMNHFDSDLNEKTDIRKQTWRKYK